MKDIYRLIHKHAIVFMALTAATLFYTPSIGQNNSVTIGSDQVKANAVLWLVPNGNQGLLLPVTERSGFSPTADEAGMVIFDPTDGRVHYWNGGQWISVGGGSGGGGNTYELQLAGTNNSTIQLLENGTPIAPAINIQDITVGGDVNGNVGNISLGAGVVTLSNMSNMGLGTAESGHILQWNGAAWETVANSGGITYTAGSGINIDGSNQISVDETQLDGSQIPGLPDNSATNEIQTITFNTTTNELNVTDPNNVNNQVVDLSTLATSGSGDMLKSDYDTDNNLQVDVAETLSGTISTAQISDITNAGSGQIITDAERTNLSNQSGINTGDEVLFNSTTDGLVPAPGTPTGRVLLDDGTWGTVGTGDITEVIAGTGLTGGGTTGSVTLDLTNTGVAAGTYPKVTVDAQGRATGGANLIASDIPTLTLAKISDEGALASQDAVSGGTGGTILDNTITDADINNTANINVQKLDYTGTSDGDILQISGGVPVWSASGSTTDAQSLQGTPIDAGLAPTGGQVLKWDGTNSQWIAGTDDSGAGGAPVLNDGEIIIGNGSVNSAAGVQGDLSMTGAANFQINPDAVTVTEIGTAGLTDADKILTTDLSGNPQWELKSNFVSGLDTDATNEYNTGFQVNAGNLEIIDGGGTLAVPLSSIDTDNQTATEVPVTPSGNLTSTNVQNALVELQGDIDGASLTDDQTAAEVPVTPSGNLASTNTQSALEELQTDIDGINALPAMTDGQIIVSNGTTPQAVTMSGDATIDNTGAVTLSNSSTTRTNLGLGALATLSTVTTTEITDGTIATTDIASGGNDQVLTTSTTGTVQWEAKTNLAGATNLDGLSDATITTPTAGQVLKYNGTVWINDTDAVNDADADATNEIQTLNGVLGTGNDAGGLGIINLLDPVNAQDAATKAYVDAASGSQNLQQVLTQGNDGGGIEMLNLGTPTNNTSAATKGYVDGITLTNILTSGNSAGNVAIIDLADPTNPQDAATRAYVDANDNDNQTLQEVLAIGNDGGGNAIINIGTPTNTNDAATKGYVDANAGASNLDGLSDATITSPASTQVLKYNGTAWINDTDAVNDADADATNEIQTLNGVLGTGNDAGGLGIINLLDPVNAQDASTKAYVDANAGAANLDGLTDATITTPAAGHMLIYDGTSAFVNNPISGDIAISSTGVSSINAAAGNNIVTAINDAGTTGTVNIDRITPAAVAEKGFLTTNGTSNSWLTTAAANKVFGTDQSNALTARGVILSTAAAIDNSGIRAAGTASDANLVSEAAVREAIDGSTTLQEAYDGGNIIQLDGTNEFTINTSAATPLLVTDDANSRVGIGIATPQATLHLFNSATNGLAIDAGTGNNSYLDFYEQGVLRANMYWDGTADKLFVNTIGSETAINPNGGNVGIGTNSPFSKLDVGVGNVEIDGEFAYTAIDASDVFTYQTKNVPQYSLGWYGDSETPGLANAWMSGFAGIKMFTNGLQRFKISQNGNVSIGATSPANNAVLDIQSTTAGLLIPRLTTTQRDAIIGPEIGLMVYNTTENAFNYWNGGAWSGVGGESTTASNGLNLSGSDIQLGGTLSQATTIDQAGNLLSINNGALLFEGATGATPTSGAGTRMMWIPAKGAFRAGYVGGTQWDDGNIGTNSVAMGEFTVASGLASIALGSGTQATITNAVALGNLSIASGTNSVALGNLAEASGFNAVAIGDHVTSPSFSEIALGTYNTSYTPVNTSGFDASDRLFTIGNGTSTTRSNAMTVLKSGNVGIGTSTPLTDIQIGDASHLFDLTTGTGLSHNMYESGGNLFHTTTGTAATLALLDGQAGIFINSSAAADATFGSSLANRLIVTETGVSINKDAPNGSAVLQVNAQTVASGGTPRGFMMPAMITTDRDAIPSPIDGLMVYNTDNKEFNFYNAGTTAWEPVGGSGGSSLQAAYDGGQTINMTAGGIDINSADGTVNYFDISETDGNVGLGGVVGNAKMSIINYTADENFSMYIDHGFSPTTGTNYALWINAASQSTAEEFGIYVNNETKNYFSGSVGIGTTTPSAKLDVVGDVETSGEYTYTSPKSRIKSLSAASFQLRNTSTALGIGMNTTGNAAWVSGGTNGTLAYFFAPIDLPDGATITSIECFHRDNDSTYDLTFELIRFVMTSNSISTVASASTSGAPGIGSVIISSGTNILNSTTSYFLKVTTVEGNSNNWIRGAVVNYTTTQVD